MVCLSCAKCGASGQYRKQKLIERYGAGIRLPDLREELSQCKRRGHMHDACKLGLEGIISKKLDAPYRSGPSKVWIKVKKSEGARSDTGHRWNILTSLAAAFPFRERCWRNHLPLLAFFESEIRRRPPRLGRLTD